MASTYLTKTFSSEGNRKVWTFSAWIKRSELGTKEIFWSGSASNNYARIGFEGNDSIKIFEVRSGSTSWEIETNAKFRDTNGWYHLVITSNTLSGTSSERTKIMVNNVEQTLSTNSQIPQNDQSTINGGSPHKIGSGYSAGFFDGSMSHIHFTDGTVYAPTAFGEYDANGVWKIKTDVSVTYGTNGFFILKDGNSVTDQSGEGNNFTVASGTLTNTEDNPSNVFATLNPLFVNDDGATNALTKGNNTYTSTTRGEWNNMTSTLGAMTGKYYWEVKYEQLIDAATIYMSDEGVASTDLAPANSNLGEGTRSGYGYGWLASNRNTTSNTRYLKTVNGTATLTTDSNNTPVVVNDIVGVAFDATNGKLWFHKNGTYIDDLSGNVGNPSSDAYPYHTGMQTGILYTVWSDVWNNASGSLLIKSYNFGNGYFGTTAVSSAGTNASGIGIFEYDVPTGYTALSTKGLNL